MTRSAPAVPAHIQPFVEILGVEEAIGFLLKFGGATVYLSTRPQERSEIATFLGREKAIAIAERTGGGTMRIPTGKPFIARHLKAKGWTAGRIARELHVTDVTVRSWLNSGDERQMSLFG